MTEAKPPPFKFSMHSSASSFKVSSQAYLLEHADSDFNYIATGALVFDDSTSEDLRILLLQRSASDSSPNLWEIPGGACDDDDETILHGASRELWEETGLVATKIGPVIGDAHLFVSRSGRKIGKFIFFVTAEKSLESEELNVRLSPTEHQSFVWASEDEVKALKAGEVDLVFTSPQLQATVLQAFKLKKDGKC